MACKAVLRRACVPPRLVVPRGSILEVLACHGEFESNRHTRVLTMSDSSACDSEGGRRLSCRELSFTSAFRMSGFSCGAASRPRHGSPASLLLISGETQAQLPKVREDSIMRKADWVHEPPDRASDKNQDDPPSQCFGEHPSPILTSRRFRAASALFEPPQL